MLSNNLPYMTHCDLLPYICDDYPPSVQLYFRIISFCPSLVNKSNQVSRLCYNLAISGRGSTVSNNMSGCILLCSATRIHNYIRSHVNYRAVNVLLKESNIIKGSIICDLLYMRHNNKYYVHNEQLLSKDDNEYMLVLHRVNVH
jgi:hypothetical protein